MSALASALGRVVYEFAFKMMDFAFKMMDYALQMMNFGRCFRLTAED